MSTLSNPTTRRTFPGGLRAQVLLLLGFISLGTLATLAVVMTQLTKTHMVRLSQTHAQDIAKMALAEMRTMPQTTTFIDRQEQLQRLQKHGRLAFIAWKKGEREVITTSKTSLVHHYRGYIQSHKNQRHFSASVDGEMYTWTTASSDAHTIVVAIPVRDLQTSLNRVSKLLWIYMFINAILITILGYAALTFLVMRPVKALNVSTDRAARGDLATAVKTIPRNEFGQLARSFNAMMMTMAENRAALESQLTALEQANTQLQQTQDSLIRAEKLASVGALAAGVAHEIGNPLAVISGYTEVLMDEANDALSGEPLDPQMTNELLGHIQNQLDRIQVIIRQLLDYSRDDSQYPPEPVSLDGVIKESISLAQTTRRTRHMDIHFEPSDGTMAMANRSELIQVLLNLLFNAADALEGHDVAQPQIEISIHQRDDLATIHFQDNGPGIAPAHHAKIFDPFFTTKEPGKGTGLGLAMCLKLLQQIGGDLTLSHSNAHGTCFVVSLPLA